MGQLLVTPAALPVASGRFQASFALQRGPRSQYCRVFRFDQTFASSEAAYTYAMDQGRLEATAPQRTLGA